jgi:hypothetical protein
MANPFSGLRDNQVFMKLSCQSYAQPPKRKSWISLRFQHSVLQLSAISGPATSQAANDAISSLYRFQSQVNNLCLKQKLRYLETGNITKQDRQFMYNVTMRRVIATIAAVEN